MRQSFRLFVVSALLLSGVGAAGADAAGADDRDPATSAPFELTLLGRDEGGKAVRERRRIDPKKTAVVVVDMWDAHWCKTYTQRVANMVPRMNQTLDAARRLGIPIVHAPSDVVSFYEDFPERKSMQAIPSFPVPEKVDLRLPPHPCGKDRCECGPDIPCKSKPVWTRQQRDLRIADGDFIADCNNARELLNFTQARAVDTLIYMGVASNMCVINRRCGMVNMKRHGLKVLFVGDLVNAITANGADPASGVVDADFTPQKGSALIQRYLEAHLAPSIESRQLIRAAGLDANSDHGRPHVVFVVAEGEYRTAETLPKFAKRYLEKDFRLTFCFARSDDGPGRNDVPGLEALLDADLLVLSMRRRALPVVQMDHLERFIRGGKPIVGLRVTVVPFQVREEDRPDGHVRWQSFDREVLGCHYRGYPAESRKSGCDVRVVEAARDHPIVQDIKPGRFHSQSWLYRLAPLSESTTLLMEGKWRDGEPEQPVAFTNTLDGVRVFFTSLGHPGDFEIEAFNHLLRNAIYWGLRCRDRKTRTP